MSKYFIVMIKKTLFFLGACSVLCGCRISQEATPELTSINIIDQNGFSETISSKDRLAQYQSVDFLKEQPYQKVLRIYSRNKCGDVQAYITSYYPNGQPKQYLEVVNNRAYGDYKEWHSNGVLKLQVFVIGGDADINTASERTWLFEGNACVWDENGNAVAIIQYSKGQLEGPTTYFHCNGSVWKRVSYCKNKMQGMFEVYLEDGQLFQLTEYVNGNKNGLSQRYWGGGEVAADETYFNGFLMQGRYYDICGNLLTTIVDGRGFRAVFGKTKIGELQEYHEGVLCGKVQIYDDNGTLKEEHFVRNETRNGEEIAYYASNFFTEKPVPKLSLNWHNGKIQGLIKTWYSNGILESQREMSENIKSGVATAWYRDGSVMLIEEYDRDRLIKGEYFRKGDSQTISEIGNGKGVATLFDGEGNFLRKVTYSSGLPSE